VKRTGRPRKEYLQNLQKRARKADYERLVTSCLEAIISGEKDVLVAFAYVTRLPDDFPRGILEDKTETSNIHRIKARKLLTWLYDKGYTTLTLEDVKQQRMNFGRFEAKIDKMLDEPQHEEHNVETDQSGGD